MGCPQPLTFACLLAGVFYGISRSLSVHSFRDLRWSCSRCESWCGINNASPSQRLEVSGTTRTSYLTLPSPGSGNAAITVDSFNAGCLIRRNAGTGVGTSLGVLYSSAAPYLAYHMYANTNSGSYAEYPLKSSSSSSLTRSAILVNNYGVALGTGLEYNASVNEAIPHTHFRYNAVVNTDGNLVLNQHTGDNTGNRGIYFRITPNQTLPFSTLSKALINFKRTTTNARGQLDLVVDAVVDVVLFITGAVAVIIDVSCSCEGKK